MNTAKARIAYLEWLRGFLKPRGWRPERVAR